MCARTGQRVRHPACPPGPYFCPGPCCCCCRRATCSCRGRPWTRTHTHQGALMCPWQSLLMAGQAPFLCQVALTHFMLGKCFMLGKLLLPCRHAPPAS